MDQELGEDVNIADIALGIFFGWFLIRFWLKFCGGMDEITATLERYFELKEKAKNELKKKDKES